MEDQDAKPAEAARPQKRPDPPPPPRGKREEALIHDETRFFHPIRLSEVCEDNPVEDEAEKSKVEIEQKLQEDLKSISEETLQLSEFLSEENKLTSELCTYLRQILSKLNIAFDILPETMPLNSKMQRVILNEKGHLIIVHEDEHVDSALLAEYPPEIVMTVFQAITPELAKAISIYRKKISTRVNFFGKMKKELRSVAKAIEGKDSLQDESDGEPILDAAKESL